jgi:lipopolysaccharide/colanic/teichoic acid biosynthesis glycosyltransferase
MGTEKDKLDKWGLAADDSLRIFYASVVKSYHGQFLLKSRLPTMNGLPYVLEAFLGFVGLIVTIPLLLTVAALIKATSAGPILFRQERLGKDGKPFVLLKFRTMRVHMGGAEVTAKGDARITPVGRLLRKTKLDELPELWNVIQGELSLVGPRPEVSRYVNLRDPLWQIVLQAKPGITDPMTLRLRNEEELLAGCKGDPESFYLNTLQRLKLEGYLEYLRHRDWLSDITVLVQTILAVFFPARNPPPQVADIEKALTRYGYNEFEAG